MKVRRILAAIFRMTAPWRQRAEAWLAKRRRTVAIGVSLALHGILIAFFLIGATSKISGGGAGGQSFGDGNGSGIGVELVAMQQATPDALKVKQPDPDNPAVADTTAPPTLDSTQAATIAPDTSDTPALTQVSDTAAEAATTPANSGGQAGGDGSGGQSSGVNDPLWQQVEPCWRRLAASGTRGALLRVTISPMGNIAQVTGDTAASLPTDPKSQAAATQALSECGPYLAHSGRENVVLSFPAAP